MWMLFARAPLPDAPYWRGRRWLAVIDAVAWPGAAINALRWVIALLVVSAAQRVYTALLANHRYHFTAWRWLRVLAWVLAMGALLKLRLAG